jgi:hypothetical protein
MNTAPMSDESQRLLVKAWPLGSLAANEETRWGAIRKQETLLKQASALVTVGAPNR